MNDTTKKLLEEKDKGEQALSSLFFTALENDEIVIITTKEYHELLEAQANLEFLGAKGVDNWSGYATLAPIKNYDTLEEWKEEVSRAFEEDLY